jgi:hypothetical protein
MCCHLLLFSFESRRAAELKEEKKLLAQKAIFSSSLKQQRFTFNLKFETSVTQKLKVAFLKEDGHSFP